jgi:ferredoxin
MMSPIQEDVRKTAAELLSDGKADIVIGFSEGSLPMRASPCFITDGGAAQRLVWNSYCSNNLAIYLPRFFVPDPRLREPPPPPKVAVFVKGCDGRSAIGLIKEQQAPRENLTLIAVPCEGMLAAAVAQRLIGTDEIIAAEEAGGTIRVKDETGKETEFPREDLLAEACRFCRHRAPEIYDRAVGELPQNEADRPADDPFDEFIGKPGEERWQQFCREISKCVLCKACRSACPNCYCKTCFADQTRPNWMGTGQELRDVIVYHLGRILHQAGRCVDCGACVRTCSMGVDLRTFTHGLVRDAEELFGYTAGLDLEQLPPLMEFSASDPEAFITEPG